MVSEVSFVDDGLDLGQRMPSFDPCGHPEMDGMVLSWIQGTEGVLADEDEDYLDDGFDLATRMPPVRRNDLHTLTGPSKIIRSSRVDQLIPRSYVDDGLKSDARALRFDSVRIDAPSVPEALQPMASKLSQSGNALLEHGDIIRGYYPFVEKAVMNDIRATLRSVHSVVSNVRIPQEKQYPSQSLLAYRSATIFVVVSKDSKHVKIVDGCDEPIGTSPRASVPRPTIQQKMMDRRPLKEIKVPNYTAGCNILTTAPRYTRKCDKGQVGGPVTAQTVTKHGIIPSFKIYGEAQHEHKQGNAIESPGRTSSIDPITSRSGFFPTDVNHKVYMSGGLAPPSPLKDGSVREQNKLKDETRSSPSQLYPSQQENSHRSRTIIGYSKACPYPHVSIGYRGPGAVCSVCAYRFNIQKGDNWTKINYKPPYVEIDTSKPSPEENILITGRTNDDTSERLKDPAVPLFEAGT